MSSTQKTRASGGRVEADEDDWETDPDYVASMTEEEQRWGGARDTGAIDMERLRAEVSDHMRDDVTIHHVTSGESRGQGGGGAERPGGGWLLLHQALASNQGSWDLICDLSSPLLENEFKSFHSNETCNHVTPR